MSCCILGCKEKVACVGVKFLDQHVWQFYCEKHYAENKVNVARVNSERCLVRLLLNERKAYNTLDKLIDQTDPAEMMRCPECKRYTASADEDSCYLCHDSLPCTTWCDPDGTQAQACEGGHHPAETENYRICSECWSACSSCHAVFCGQPECGAIDPPTGYAKEDGERICSYCREGR